MSSRSFIDKLSDSRELKPLSSSVIKKRYISCSAAPFFLSTDQAHKENGGRFLSVNLAEFCFRNLSNLIRLTGDI